MTLFIKKDVLANSGDNGVWLCNNYYGMFDSNLYCFDSKYGKVVIRSQDYDAIKAQLEMDEETVCFTGNI